MAPSGTIRADVAIVGSGAAGVTAAIEASEAGASVVVLEREDHLGGAAAISGGGCFVVDSPLQRRSGVSDSFDLALRDWLDFGQGEADEHWARFYIERSLPDLYEWAERRGVQWARLMRQEGNSVPRWHNPEGGGGRLWRTLHKSAAAVGADRWLACTAAKELVVEGGRVGGVRAERTDTGELVEVHAKAVVMASGGFASNVDMVYQYRPDLKRYNLREGGHVGATGHGHRIVEKAGGVLTHMDELWIYAHAIPDHRNPRRGFAVRIVPGFTWVWVNMRGRRFHDESLHGGDSATAALLSQEPPECWAVIDGTMVGSLSVASREFYQDGSSYPDPAKLQKLLKESPFIKSSETLRGLALDTGVPADALAESIARYNDDIERGLERDSDFGRPLAGMPKIEKPPFYAFHFVPLARKTLGGVKTDLRCRALDSRGAPIPGLYAAGELAGMAGGHINGKACLEGTMLGPSLFSGRVAGAWAANEAGFGKGFM